MRIRALALAIAAVSLVFAAPAGATSRGTTSTRAASLLHRDVMAFGDAKYEGSTNSLTLNLPIVGIAGTKTAHGYWEAASNGAVFTFGDARFHGSMGATHLNAPIVGIAATPTGNGYWLAASDGGIFTFGDAQFHGSMGGERVGQSVVAVAARTQGDGYWTADADGRVVPFGHAPGLGDAVASDLSMPVVAIAATRSGKGYWVAGRGAEVVLPEQVAEPGCAPDGSERAVRPASFVLACGDGNSRIDNATWSTWAADHASGAGTLTQNDCVPSCAAGHFHSVAGSLTLFQPVEFHGHLVFSRLRVQLQAPLAPYASTTITFTLV